MGEQEAAAKASRAAQAAAIVFFIMVGGWGIVWRLMRRLFAS